MRSYYNGNGGGGMDYFVPLEFGYDSIVKFEDEGTVVYNLYTIFGIEPDGHYVLYVKRERIPRYTLSKIGEWEKVHLVII